MKIKNLIEALKECDQELDVCTWETNLIDLAEELVKVSSVSVIDYNGEQYLVIE